MITKQEAVVTEYTFLKYQSDYTKKYNGEYDGQPTVSYMVNILLQENVSTNKDGEPSGFINGFVTEYGLEKIKNVQEDDKILMKIFDTENKDGKFYKNFSLPNKDEISQFEILKDKNKIPKQYLVATDDY